jgi:hypothetical protein
VENIQNIPLRLAFRRPRVENIPAGSRFIGHTWRIFPQGRVSLASCGECSLRLAFHWPCVENIPSGSRFIGAGAMARQKVTAAILTMLVGLTAAETGYGGSVPSPPPTPTASSPTAPSPTAAPNGNDDVFAMIGELIQGMANCMEPVNRYQSRNVIPYQTSLHDAKCSLIDAECSLNGAKCSMNYAKYRTQSKILHQWNVDAI